MIAIVADELEWLLDAQIDLTTDQLGCGDLKSVWLSSRADVVDLAIAEAKRCGRTWCWSALPVAVAGHDSVESMTGPDHERDSAEVAVVLPEPPAASGRLLDGDRRRRRRQPTDRPRP